jgi:hypothetical protein
MATSDVTEHLLRAVDHIRPLIEEHAGGNPPENARRRFTRLVTPMTNPA